MKNTYTKQEAVKIVTEAAREFDELLKGNNYLFIYKNRETNKIDYFETNFQTRHFQHLTGLERIDTNGNIMKQSNAFYAKCQSGTLGEAEIQFKKDGTTPLKLETLPIVVHFLKTSKMTALYNGMKPKLMVDRLVGTVKYCIGFIKEGRYYVPSSCLKEDIRNIGENPSQILAVFSKKAVKEEQVYKTICYVAKGVPLTGLTLPNELSKMISLENYRADEKEE